MIYHHHDWSWLVIILTWVCAECLKLVFDEGFRLLDRRVCHQGARGQHGGHVQRQGVGYLDEIVRVFDDDVFGVSV